MNREELERLSNETERIQEDCDFSKRRHYIARSDLNRIHLLLGLSSTLFAVLAGISVTEIPYLEHYNFEHVTAISAVAAAVFSGFLTFLDCKGKAQLHQVYGGEYDALMVKCRQLRELKIYTVEKYQDGLESLQGITEKRSELNKLAPVTSKRNYRLAKRDIEQGSSRHQVDRRSE